MTFVRSSSARLALEALGLRLKELRSKADLTAAELARRAGWHDGTKVSKIEHGKQTPHSSDVRKWCEICDAPDQLDELMAALSGVESMYLEWKRLERAKFSEVQRSYSRLFKATRRFHIYEPGVIPGLLQTPCYATARLTRIAEFGGHNRDIEQAVAERMSQKTVLHRADSRVAVVIEENALWSRIGGTEMMLEQLRHLAGVAKYPPLTFGIVPMHVERVMWSSAGFAIFDKMKVLVETPTAQLTVTQPGEIQIYLRTFEALMSMAVYGKNAETLITKAADALSKQGVAKS